MIRLACIKWFYGILLLVSMLALTPLTASAAPPPVVFYTDIVSGPNNGGENNNGIYLSIFGKNFGSNISNVKVYIGGGEVARYMYLGPSLSRQDIQQLSVQIGPQASTGPIKVVVDGAVSNIDKTFTVRTGNIYFVSLAGSNSTGAVNNVSKPFRTPNYLWAQGFGPGDFIVIRGGNYDLDAGTEGLESGRWINVTMDRTGTVDRPLTFMGYPGETVKASSSQHNVAFRTSRGDWLVLANMWGHIGSSYGNMFQVAGVTQGVDITTDTRFVNMLVTGGGIADSGGSQFEIGRVERFKLYGFTVRDSAEDPTSISRAHNIYLGARMQDVEVGWCEISNIKGGRAALQVYTDNYTGFWDVEPCIDEIKIHDCLIHDIPERAILLAGGTQDVWVYNNIIYNSNKQGAGWTTMDMPGDGNHLRARIYNNTIYDTQSSSFMRLNDFGKDVEFIEFYNNILFAGNSSVGYVESQDPLNTINITSNNNIWFGSGNSMPSFAGVNDKSVNPKFVNPAAGNFLLLPDSPAIDSGTGLVLPTVSMDYKGSPRLTGMKLDIGAFEYQTELVPYSPPLNPKGQKN